MRGFAYLAGTRLQGSARIRGALLSATLVLGGCRNSSSAADQPMPRPLAPISDLVPQLGKETFAHFAIDCPPAWELVRSAPTAVLWMCRDRAATHRWFGENCNVTVEPFEYGREPSPNEYANEVLRASTALVPTDENTNFEVLRVHGRDAVRFWLRHSSMGRPLTAMVTAMVSPGRGWVVTCTAEEEQFGRYEKQFQEVTESFEVVRNPPFDIPPVANSIASVRRSDIFLVRVFWPGAVPARRVPSRDRWLNPPN
jgi:hypothetical protein